MLVEFEIKPAFHQLIEEIDNKEYLRELYDSISGLLAKKTDTLEGLNAIEVEKLQKSISEAKNGQFKSDNEVRQKIAQKWLTK